MLTNPTASRRLAGRAMLFAAVAVALPLTATWAINYVDPPAPAAPATPAAVPASPATPAAQASAIAPVASLSPVAAVQAVHAVAPRPDDIDGEGSVSFIGKDTVRIHGKTKKWEELTPAERAEIRTRTDEARRQIKEQLARLPEELAQARHESERFRNGEFQREMAEAREGMKQAMASIEQQAAILRATGQDPEKLKADIRRSLSEVEKMDIDKIVRESLASVDPDKIRRSVESAAQSLDEIDAKLDRLDDR